MKMLFAYHKPNFSLNKRAHAFMILVNIPRDSKYMNLSSQTCRTISCSLNAPVQFLVCHKSFPKFFYYTKRTYTQPKIQIPILLDQPPKVPNFIEDINARLLQEDIFYKSAWDGNLLSAGLDEVLTDASLLHYVWAKVFCCIHHRLKECLQHSKQKITLDTGIHFSLGVTALFCQIQHFQTCSFYNSSSCFPNYFASSCNIRHFTKQSFENQNTCSENDPRLYLFAFSNMKHLHLCVLNCQNKLASLEHPPLQWMLCCSCLPSKLCPESSIFISAPDLPICKKHQ